MWTYGVGLEKENIVAMQSKGLPIDSVREDFSEYVAIFSFI